MYVYLFLSQYISFSDIAKSVPNSGGVYFVPGKKYLCIIMLEYYGVWLSVPIDLANC